MKLLLRSLLLAAGVGITAISAHAQTLLWNNGTGQNNQTSGYFSSQLRNWRVYDDFSLGANSQIGSVWFQQGTTDPLASELQSFSFSIYGSAGGLPGALLYTTTLNPGHYTATQNGISSYPFGPFYDISFNLNTPVSLNAGNYFVSMYGLGSTDFRTPNTGTGNAFLQQFGVGGFNSRPGNTPFRLYSPASVPDTGSTLSLMAVAFGAMAAFRRRRAKVA